MSVIFKNTERRSGMEEPKLTDGFGMKQLRLTYTQVQAIEKYVKRYVEFKMNENENNDK